MRDTSEDKQRLAKIREIGKEIYYSSAACEWSKISELARMAAAYEYMDFDRVMLRHSFEKHQSFKRETKKAEAWERVKEHAWKLRGLAAMADSPP